MLQHKLLHNRKITYSTLLHQYLRGHEFNSYTGLNVFQLSMSLLLNKQCSLLWRSLSYSDLIVMQILHCNLMFSSFYVLNENHTWTVKLILRSNLLVANINMVPTVNQSFTGPWDMQGWRAQWKRQAMKWKPQRQYGKEWQLTPSHPTPLLSSHLS